MSERINSNLVVARGVFDPSLALEADSEFAKLFDQPERLSEGIGQRGGLAASALLEGTAVGELVSRVDAEVAEQGYSVGATSGSQPVWTFELAAGSHHTLQRNDRVDGLALAILKGSAAIQLGEDSAELLPGDVSFVEGDQAKTIHRVSALTGSFATGLLIGATVKTPEFAETA